MYGNKLDPYRSKRTQHGVKGIRTSIVIPNNPSSIAAGQLLNVRFPPLGADDVIVPGTTRLSFNITLTSTDDNKVLVNNLGRAIVKQVVVKLEGNEIFSLDDADVFKCFSDLWKTTTERSNLVLQGICNENTLKLRSSAADASTTVVADVATYTAYGSRFAIPLDFELLESHMPFYQNALADKLSYELRFNDHSAVVTGTDAAATYTVSGISMEYETVRNPQLARQIKNQYESQLVILYDRVLRHTQRTLNKRDTIWNMNINTSARSLKGILLLFKEAVSTDPEKFYNPKIKKVTVAIDGLPNQLYASGLLQRQHFTEAQKHFTGGPESAMSVAKYLTSGYGLWLDMRSTDDNSLHGTGRKLDTSSDGVTIHLERAAETAGDLTCYIFVIMDAQINIKEGRFLSAIF